jgi:hypothetical protein
MTWRERLTDEVLTALLHAAGYPSEEDARTPSSTLTQSFAAMRAVLLTALEGAEPTERVFLQKLPRWMSAPEAMIEDDGETGFDWNEAHNCVLSASVRADGRVSWAALVDDFKGHGTFTLPDWPDDWIDALQRYDAREGRPAAAREGAEEPPTHFMDGGKPVCEAMQPFGDDTEDITCVACLRVLSDRPFPAVDRLMEAVLEVEPAGAEPQRPQPPAEFNTNDYVWVRLQKRGLDAIAADPLEAACHAHRKNVNGWTRWQLWQLMSTLGHLCFMGPEPPFETTIRFAEPVAHAQTPAPTPERPA